jgi:hypothetical protein
VPFLYTRTGNKNSSSLKPPPAALDLAAPERDVWEKLFWTVLQNVLLDPYGTPIKASTRSYRQNVADYRKSQIIRALSVLSIYQAINGTPAFSQAEMSEIQGRLLLTDKTFGGLVDDLHLEHYYGQERMAERDIRGHNWELLRQRAEAESLYFEPLEMPDGSATHALLWVATSDLTAGTQRTFSKRFLNIADPWTDKRLLNWQGYRETRYFDSQNRPVDADTPGAHPVEMIPLALYGLDYPKIPMLLVDFRDQFNPKKREMSRRLLQDITRNVLSVSKFGNLPYFVGRTVYDFVTGRRGMDFNQPSRLRTYAQLKLLLSLDDSLNPDLRGQITDRLETVSLNPLENDLAAEVQLAKQQYQALLAYARRPDGLPAKLDRDRRVEMVGLEHGKKQQFMFRLANVLSFGMYTHREESTPEMEASRRFSYHIRFLQELARSTPQIDVSGNLEEVKRSLQFIADHGSEANSKAVSAAARIFTRTNDSETRRLCVDSLSRIANPKARAELLRISQTKDLDPGLKDLVSTYLSSAPQTGSLTASGSKSALGRTGQQ